VNGLTREPAFNASLSLVPRRGTVFATGSLQRAPVSRDGTFEFKDVAPGSYDVVGTVASEAGTLAGSAPVEIGRGDVENVIVTLLPQLSISGRITLDTRLSDPAAFNFQRIRLQLRREPFIPELLVLIPTIAADGTFKLNGVTPGEYQLKMETPQGYMKSARFGAGDALNPPFTVSAPGELEIVLGSAVAIVDAAVVDRMQKPVPDATVVLIPDPPRRRRLDLYDAGGSNSSGHVLFRSVAPGDYRLFAWDDVPADAWQDPDFMRAYDHLGTPVHVSESGNQTVQTEIIPKR